MTAGHTIEAVVFDMDGLIVDTEPLWQDAEIELFATVGVELDRDLCRQTMGMRIDEVVDHWHRRSPWASPPPVEVAAAVLDRMVELVTTKAEMLPGVVEAIELFRAAGLVAALASSSSYRLIDAVVDRFGLRDAFAVIHSAEEEEYGKPHPAVYLTAAAKLGVEASHCLALEDSVNGLVSAKAARMRCVVVPEAAALDDPRFGLADLVLPSLAQFDAAALAALGGPGA